MLDCLPHTKTLVVTPANHSLAATLPVPLKLPIWCLLRAPPTHNAAFLLLIRFLLSSSPACFQKSPCFHHTTLLPPPSSCTPGCLLPSQPGCNKHLAFPTSHTRPRSQLHTLAPPPTTGGATADATSTCSAADSGDVPIPRPDASSRNANIQGADPSRGDSSTDPTGDGGPWSARPESAWCCGECGCCWLERRLNRAPGVLRLRAGLARILRSRGGAGQRGFVCMSRL